MVAAAIVSKFLSAPKRKWLVTGAAGFIGSHLVSNLLALGHEVVGLDNFATGKQSNIDDAIAEVSPSAARQFQFIHGDILDPKTCADAMMGVDIVLHQAALGSVPRSLKDPIATNRVNVEGFIQILMAARAAGVGRMVYASSSSVYGNTSTFPMVEDVRGDLLSPYATSKWANELYAQVFSRSFGMSLIGLRYFNVFGPRQDPNGEYAAVIPRWINSRLNGQPCTIYGDGSTSRDFCFVDNVVQANILAGYADQAAHNLSYNIALGQECSLLELYSMIEAQVGSNPISPIFTEFRNGDIRRSRADISRARSLLSYQPIVEVAQGLKDTVQWFRTALGGR